MSRVRWKIAIVLLAAGFPTLAAAQTAVKIHDILRDPSVYNEQDIAVFGTLESLTHHEGYDLFKICGRRCLNVIAWGHPRIAEGQAASVRGRFHTVKTIDHQRLKNVMEVQKGTL
jgi:hypothetical protein